MSGQICWVKKINLRRLLGRPEEDNLDDEGPEGHVLAEPVTPHRKTRVEHNTNQDEQVDGLFTVQEEKDHEL